MNSWNGIGRLTKDPVVRYTTNEKAVASFSIAIARGGKEDPVDYIPCKAFGKTAEILEQYGKKGLKIGVNGTIQTGSYEKDGKKVYTTEVLVIRMEFCESARTKEEPKEEPKAEKKEAIPEGFAMLDADDEFPF